ncbi:MAG: hypothetical protein Q7R96_01395 [Nanoarchaeota archaeon]|nr:hypothetical protein [Nanoarchaeota archaeon]
MGWLKSYMGNMLRRQETPFQLGVKLSLAKCAPDDQVSLQTILSHLTQHNLHLIAVTVDPEKRYAQFIAQGKKDSLLAVYHGWSQVVRDMPAPEVSDIPTVPCICINNRLYRSSSQYFSFLSRGVTRLDDGGLVIDINLFEK